MKENLLAKSDWLMSVIVTSYCYFVDLRCKYSNSIALKNKRSVQGNKENTFCELNMAFCQSGEGSAVVR